MRRAAWVPSPYPIPALAEEPGDQPFLRSRLWGRKGVKIVQICVKNAVRIFCNIIYKNKECIKDQCMIQDFIKLLDETASKTLFDINHSNIF